MRDEQRDALGHATGAPDAADPRAGKAAAAAATRVGLHPLEAAGPVGLVTLRARLALLRPRPVKVQPHRARRP
jgi:hypothetical protein